MVVNAITPRLSHGTVPDLNHAWTLSHCAKATPHRHVQCNTETTLGELFIAKLAAREPLEHLP